MQTIKLILETAAIVVIFIAGLLLALYLLLLFFDRWLKFKTGDREREGLSNLLIGTYKGKNPDLRPQDDGESDSVSVRAEQQTKHLNDDKEGL